MNAIEKPLNERALAILKRIIERYIREGQPVGSKAIAEESGMSLSAATVRNIMSDLEELGYLHSPHTSAGRIPTAQGYRLFVNTLLTAKPLSPANIPQLAEMLTADLEPTQLVETASSLLSNLTRMASMVTLPKRECFTLRQIEFLSLSNNRVLIILVLNNREVQNRIIYTNHKYTPSELEWAGNYLTQKYVGKDLLEIHSALTQAIETDRDHLRSIMNNAMDIVEKAFEKKTQEDVVITGEANLLEMAEGAGLGKLRTLFQALTEKRDILHLLEQCLQTNGVQIFIGKESGYDVLDDCSIVTAPYSVEGKIVGALGVIGPTRMAYNHVISMVDITAKMLSAALGD